MTKSDEILEPGRRDHRGGPRAEHVHHEVFPGESVRVGAVSQLVHEAGGHRDAEPEHDGIALREPHLVVEAGELLGEDRVVDEVGGLVRAAGIGASTEEPFVREVEALVRRLGERVDRAPRHRASRDQRGQQELELLGLDRRRVAARLNGLGLSGSVAALAVEMERGAGVRLVPIQEGKRPARRALPPRRIGRGRRSRERRECGRVLRGERVRQGQNGEAEDEGPDQEHAGTDQSRSLTS